MEVKDGDRVDPCRLVQISAASDGPPPAISEANLVRWGLPGFC